MRGWVRACVGGWDEERCTVEIGLEALTPSIMPSPSKPAAAPLPGSEGKEPPRCPHIYGPIELAAVVEVSGVQRDEDGTFVGI